MKSQNTEPQVPLSLGCRLFKLLLDFLEEDRECVQWSPSPAEAERSRLVEGVGVGGTTATVGWMAAAVEPVDVQVLNTSPDLAFDSLRPEQNGRHFLDI